MQPSASSPKSPVSVPSQDTSPFFYAAILIVVMAFGQSLFRLAKLSLNDDLYSHVLLIPVVSLYLIWSKRSSLPANSGPNRGLALALFAAGGVLLGYAWGKTPQETLLEIADSLAPRILSFLLFLVGICAWLIGRRRLRALAFPLAFLIFMVPFPTVVREGLETFLQHGSAAAAHVLFKISGMTVFYENLIFRLPGINLEVAPECSGIRSSLALFITSVLAAHFFLRSPWKGAVLCAAVIPLALLRNGFRVFTIGELCVRVSPDMIDSYIHHKGGPIFFALSLIPFFLLLWFLFRSEQRQSKTTAPHP